MNFQRFLRIKLNPNELLWIITNYYELLRINIVFVYYLDSLGIIMDYLELPGVLETRYELLRINENYQDLIRTLVGN